MTFTPPSPTPITDRHREVEARIRELVSDADLPAPDGVDYEPDAVVFFWHPQRLAVVVDFDRVDEDGPDLVETVATTPYQRPGPGP